MSTTATPGKTTGAFCGLVLAVLFLGAFAPSMARASRFIRPLDVSFKQPTPRLEARQTSAAAAERLQLITTRRLFPLFAEHGSTAEQMTQANWQYGVLGDYEYDGDNLRLRKTVGADDVVYIRDAGGNVLAEYDGANTLLAEYIYANGRQVAKVEPGAGGDSVHFFHSDQLGTALVITDGSGALTWRGEYYPFGEEYSSEGTPNRYRFTERETDQATGLSYMRARYYNPHLGRFLTVDPVGGKIESSQSWNRYSYVLNNPVKLVDPDGEFAITAIAVGIGAILAAEWANTPESADDPVVTDPQYENSGGGRALAGGLSAAPFGLAVDLMVASHQSTQPEIVPSPEQQRRPRTKKMSPDPNAKGGHTVFKTDHTGKVTGYTEYDSQGRPVKRFRGHGSGQGKSGHGGIDPPLILEPKPSKGPGSPLKVPRKPRPDELPRGYSGENND